jgi:(+)-trans-carveol dehydrogenase
MGRFDGKVALVTGIARGQGRSHAIALARDGADIIGVDAAASIETVDYPPATADELGQTVSEVEALGRRIVADVCDVRDGERLKAIVDRGVAALGRLDLVVANAGVLARPRLSWEFTQEEWQTTIDINLTGVWQTTRVAIPHVLATGEGGSIVLVASTGGHTGAPHVSNYVAAKHGVIGLMRSLANELGTHRVRVNAACPTSTLTTMIDNDATARLFRPDLENPRLEDGAAALQPLHILPEPWIEPQDVTSAVLWLLSDEARYVTGTSLLIDLGHQAKYGAG